jgi:hypothetical protein
VPLRSIKAILDLTLNEQTAVPPPSGGLDAVLESPESSYFRPLGRGLLRDAEDLREFSLHDPVGSS